MPVLDRVQVIKSHSGVARFIAECSPDFAGHIPRQLDIPSPYAYSPEWPVWDHEQLGPVVVREVSHRRYEVFAVPADMIVKEPECA